MADKKLNTEGVDLSVFKTKKLNTEGIDLSVFDNAENTEPDLSNPVKTENVQTEQSKPDIYDNLTKIPCFKKVYGNKGENLVINKDENFKPFEIGYGGIEFYNEGQDKVSYDDKHVYDNPNPEKKYGVKYYPNEFVSKSGVKSKVTEDDIYLDLLHGMKKDQQFNAYRNKFKEQVLKDRKEDINYFYNKDKESGFANDGYERWVDNYTDGLLRSELDERQDSDYAIERKGNSPEIKKIASDIKKYMRTQPDQQANKGLVSTPTQEFLNEPLKKSKGKEAMLSSIKDADEKNIFGSAIDQTESWYKERGGLTPIDKMEQVGERLKQLDKQINAEAIANMNDKDIQQLELDYQNKAKEIANELGLDVDDEGNISVPEGERQMFEDKLAFYLSTESKKKNKEAGFFENFVNKLAAGQETFSANTLDMVGAATGLNNIKSYKRLSEGSRLRSEQLSAQANRYDQSIEDYVKSGDVGAAAGLAVSSAFESLPSMIPVFANPSYGLYAMSAMSGIDKYRQIENKDIPEWQKVYNAFISGASEYAGEKLVTIPILTRSKQALLSLGETRGKVAIEQAVKRTMESNVSKLGKMPEWVAEGMSEVATGISTDLVDKVTVNPDKKIGEGAGDNFVVGAVMGKIFSLPQDIAQLNDRQTAKKFAKEVVDKLPADMDVETKINVAWKIAERDALVNAENKLDEKFKGKYQERIVGLNTEIEKEVGKYSEKAQPTVGKVEPVSDMQNQLDYLKEQEVDVPDGTTAAQLKTLYDETKAKATETKTETKTKTEKITPIEDTPAKVVEFTGDELKDTKTTNEVVLYRGKGKDSKNTGAFYSDSEGYAKKFAAAKSGEVEKVILPKGTKIFSIGYDNGLKGLVEKIKSVIPDLTTEEETAILDRKHKDVLKNRGYDGISYLEEEADNKEATTYELFEPNKILKSKQDGSNGKGNGISERTGYERTDETQVQGKGEQLQLGTESNVKTEQKGGKEGKADKTEVQVEQFKKGSGGTKGTFKDENGNIYKSLIPQQAVFEDGKVKRVPIKDKLTDEHTILSELQDKPYVPKVGKVVETSEGKAFEIEELEEADNITKEEYIKLRQQINELNDNGYFISDKVSVMRRKNGELVITDFSNAYKGDRGSRDVDSMMDVEEKLSKQDKAWVDLQKSADSARKTSELFKGETKPNEYLLTQRPPSIGTHPIENIVGDPIEQQMDGRSVWKLAYSKPLSSEDIKRFELSPVLPINEYMGKIVDGITDGFQFYVKNIKDRTVTLEAVSPTGKRVENKMRTGEFLEKVQSGELKLSEPTIDELSQTKQLNAPQTATTVKSETAKQDTEIKSKSSETQQTETKQVTKQTTKSETVKPIKQKELPISKVFTKATKALNLVGKETTSMLGKTARNGKINGVDVVVQQGNTDNEIIIESMRTPSSFRQKGKATKALQTITEQADKDGITLKLRAVPQKGSKITEQQLKSFYEKNGFEFEGIEGTRIPKDLAAEAQKKVSTINRLIDDARYYDKIPNNQSKNKAKAGNGLQKLANSIGYTIGKDAKGNTTVFDENNKPIAKKISVRETQENIQAHKALNDYEDKNFINIVNKLVTFPVYLNGVRLYGLKPSEISQGAKNILDGKKTVAANNLLDALEEVYSTGDINFQDGSGVSLGKLIESIDAEDIVEYSPLDNVPERIIDKINSGKGLNETDIRELEDAFISNEQIEELKEYSNERQSDIERENIEFEKGVGVEEKVEKDKESGQIVSKQSKSTEDGKEKRQGQGRQEVLTPEKESDITGDKSGNVTEPKFPTNKNVDAKLLAQTLIDIFAEPLKQFEKGQKLLQYAQEQFIKSKNLTTDDLSKLSKEEFDKLSKEASDWLKTNKERLNKELEQPKTTPQDKAEAAKAKIAQGFSDLADLIGAKKSLTGEQRESAIKAIQRIIEGLVELGIAKGMSIKDAVLNYAKDNKFTIPEDLIDEAIAQRQPKLTEQYPIGTTNAKVRTSREMRGLEAIPKADRVANKDLWQSVVDKIANGTIIPRQTVKDILSTPEVETSETKEAVVKWDRWRILKETKYTVEEIEAKQNANDNTGLVDLFMRKAELEVELQENDLAAEKLGATWGRAGQFRQRNLEEDMTLAAIIREAKILNGGKELTVKQEQRFKQLSEKFEKLQAEYDKLRGQEQERQDKAKAEEDKKRKAAEQKLINDIQNNLVRQTPKAMRDFDTQFKADVRKQKLSEKENTIKERLKERLGRLANLQFAVGEEGSAMIVEELSGVIKDMSELGIVKLEQGIDRIISKVKDYMMSVDKKFDGKNLDKYKDEIKESLGIEKVVDGEYERLITKLVEKSILGFDTGVKSILNEIVYNRVVSGRETIDDVVDDIYESVKDRIANIDKRKIRDAISGYGEFRKLSKEEADIKVRELKRQGRLDSAIEDVEDKNQLPLRTGVERDTQTQQTRQKQARILKEIKERDLVPPPTEDEQETQWRNGLQAYQRRLENAIEDIEKEIATGERKAKSQSKKYDSPELDILRTELERLKKVREAIDKESGKYVEQREQAIIKATERAIAELEIDIDKMRQGIPTDKTVTTKGKGVFGLSKAAKEKITSDKIEELRKLKESLQQQLSELMPDAIKDKALLEKYKQQRQRRLEQLLEQQRTKDYGERPKPYRPTLDKATIEINRSIERLKYDIEKEKEQIRLDNRTWKERLGESVLNAWNLPKALMASIDLSAPFRQGIVMISKPKLFGKAFKEMFVYAFSKNAYEDWLFDLKTTDAYYEMIENGLYIAEPTAKLSAKEENFMSNWLRYVDKIPLYGAFRAGSERAYIGFLNKLRIDVYLNFQQKLNKTELTKDEITEELKSYSHFINTATGRGKLSMKFGQKEVFTLEGVAPVLNSVFFSPRLIASRLAAFNPAFYANMSSRTRKDAIKTYLGSAGIIMSTLMLSAIAFYDDDKFEIETDPRSADFMKIRYGNILYDLWGGHQQVARTLSQVITGQVKKDGRVQKMEGNKWYGQTRANVLTKFFSNKLSPSAALIKDILQGGKDYEGKDITVTGELINKTMPLYLRDVKEAVQEEGWEFTFIAGFPALFGVGVQTYAKTKKEGTGNTETDYIEQLPEEIPDMSFMEAIDGYEQTIPENPEWMDIE